MGFTIMPTEAGAAPPPGSPRTLRPTPTHLSLHKSNSTAMSRIFSQIDLSPSASFSARPSQADLNAFDQALARELSRQLTCGAAVRTQGPSLNGARARGTNCNCLPYRGTDAADTRAYCAFKPCVPPQIHSRGVLVALSSDYNKGDAARASKLTETAHAGDTTRISARTAVFLRGTAHSGCGGGVLVSVFPRFVRPCSSSNSLIRMRGRALCYVC